MFTAAINAMENGTKMEEERKLPPIIIRQPSGKEIFDKNQQCSSPKSTDLMGTGKKAADVKWVGSDSVEKVKRNLHRRSKSILVHQLSSKELEAIQDLHYIQENLPALKIAEENLSDENELHPPQTPQTQERYRAEISRQMAEKH
ncbi:hypothetical protein niasHT_038214 [Heterodera trifolii]|uniref:Uncharacterized protein n=1 Tax=Heterodera trifolii TaxID=157864 RepID=A0ABD2IWK8_9BILA